MQQPPFLHVLNIWEKCSGFSLASYISPSVHEGHAPLISSFLWGKQTNKQNPKHDKTDYYQLCGMMDIIIRVKSWFMKIHSCLIRAPRWSQFVTFSFLRTDQTEQICVFLHDTGSLHKVKVMIKWLRLTFWSHEKKTFQISVLNGQSLKSRWTRRSVLTKNMYI